MNTQGIGDIPLKELKDIWMSRGIRTFNAETDCKEILEYISENNAPVLIMETDEFNEEHISGVISPETCIKFFDKNVEKIMELKAKDVMEKNFVSTPPAVNLANVCMKMKVSNTYYIIIVAKHFDKNIPMGYISVNDVLKIISETF